LQARWSQNLRHLGKTKMMRRSLASTIHGLEGALRSTCTKNPIGRNREPARLKGTANEVALLHLHPANAFCERAQRQPSPKLYHTHPASSTYSTINAHESLELLVEFQGLYRAYCFPPFCGETKTVSALCGVVSVVKDSKDFSSAKRIDDCTRVWNQTICFAFDGSQ